MTARLRILLPLLITVALISRSEAQQIQVSSANRTVSVTVTATATAEADKARLQIGFTTYAADQNSAYASASRLSNAITSALLSSGVAPDRIRSESQTISEQPIFNLQQMPEPDRSHHRFQVKQHWSVLTNASDAAEVLNTAINAGANDSGNVEWIARDEMSLQSTAETKALAQATALASQLATGLHATLGTLLFADNEPIAVPTAGADGAIGGLLGGVGGQEPPAVRPLRIFPQQISRSATVHAVFSLKDLSPADR